MKAGNRGQVQEYANSSLEMIQAGKGNIGGGMERWI